jgi:hypothetical protein
VTELSTKTSAAGKSPYGKFDGTAIERAASDRWQLVDIFIGHW